MTVNRISGATIYIQEELSDARLRCDELKNYISKAFRILESSPNKNSIYAICGDIIQAVPVCLLKLERSLEATALAVNKIDYEEIRQSLRPEKVEELERVLDDIRIKIPRRTSDLFLNPPDSYEVL